MALSFDERIFSGTFLLVLSSYLDISTSIQVTSRLFQLNDYLGRIIQGLHTHWTGVCVSDGTKKGVKQSSYPYCNIQSFGCHGVISDTRLLYLCLQIIS